MKHVSVPIDKTKPHKTGLLAKKSLQCGMMPIRYDKIQAAVTCPRSDCKISMQNKGKCLSSVQEGLRLRRAWGGVQEMVAGQLVLENPDTPHLHHCPSRSGAKFRNKMN